MVAGDNTIVLGTRVETSEALAGIQRFADDAGEQLRELAAGGDGDARKLLLDTEEAEASLRRVEEEFRQTGRTSEEALRQAEEGLRRVSGALGFEKDLQLVASEFEDISRASKEAERALERFGSVAGRQVRGAKESATQAQVAIAKLEAAIEATRRTGGPVSPEWERRLAGLREEMRRGVETAGRFAAAQKEVQDELAASTERAAGFDEQATTLTDGILKRMPKAQAAFVGFTASVATLRESYQTTREYVAFVKQYFGVDIDAAVQKATLAVLEYIETQEKARRVTSQGTFIAEELELERNAVNISEELRRRQGETLEELAQRIDDFRGGVRKLIQEEYAANQATRAFLEGAAGVKLEDLESRIKRVSEVLRNFGGDFSKLSAAGILPQFSDEVEDLAEILRKFGPALRETLNGDELKEFDALLAVFRDGVKDKLRSTVEYALDATRELLAAFGVQTPEAIRKSTDSLRGLIEVYGGLGKVTQEQAAQVAAEADRILKAIALLPPGQRAALADITASLHATSDAYRKHAEDVAAFAASGTAAIEEATAKRLAAYEKEKAALAGLTASAGSARDALLRGLEPPGRQTSRGDRQTDPRHELQELKLKPIQSEEDLARIEELEDQLGSLREKQKAAAASSDDVAAAIVRFREELKSAGTVLTDLDKGAIAAFLSRLQQTADEGGATAAVIEDAFGAVNRTVAAAKERAAQLNSSATAAAEAARLAAATAGSLESGVADIVGVVQEGGQTLITDLQTAVATGGELIDRTVDQGKKATADVVAVVKDGQITITQLGSATAEAIASYGHGAEVIKDTIKGATESTKELLQVGVDKLGDGLDRIDLDWVQLGTSIEKVGAATKETGEGLRVITQEAEGAGEGIKLITNHATTAAGPVEKLAGGLRAAASSVEPLHSSADAFHAMAQDAPGLADDLSRLEPADKTAARADAYQELAGQLQACAGFAERLSRALDPKRIREEADALNKLADALLRVAEGLDAERAAREGEGAPN